MENNAGNLKNPDGSFQSFDTPEAGYQAMQSDITAKVSGNSPAMQRVYGKDYQPTLSNILNVYAPPSENDTENYINFVSKRAGIDPNTPLSVDDVPKIIPHMIQMEQGTKGAAKYKQYADSGQIMNDAGTQSPQAFKELPAGFELDQPVSEKNSLPAGFELDQLQPQYTTDPVRTAYQGVINNVAAPINAVISDANKAMFGTQPAPRVATPTGSVPIENKIGDYIASSPVGVAAKEAATEIGEGYKDLASYNPDLQKDLSALGQNAQLLGNVTAAKGLEAPATDIISKLKASDLGVGDLMKDASGNVPYGTTPRVAPQAAITNIDTITAAAKQRYANASALGGQLKPSAVNDAIDAAKAKSGYQTEEGKIFSGDNQLTQTLNNLEKLRDKPISLDGLDEIDGKLRSDISKAMRIGDNETASGLMDIRDILRNTRNTAKPEDIVNPQAFNEWRAADTLWSAKSKMQDMQNIVDNAPLINPSNPSTAIKNGFKNLYLRLQKNSMGYNDDEIAAVGRAAKTGIVTGALKTMGSKLIAGTAGGTAGALGGGALGALGGVAAGEAVGYPMRAAANALQARRATAASNLVASRPSVLEALKPSPMPDIAPVTEATPAVLPLASPVPPARNSNPNVQAFRANQASNVPAFDPNATKASINPAPPPVPSPLSLTIHPQQELPKVDLPSFGLQTSIAGTEPISDKQLAERKMQQPMRANVAQQPMDVGIFDMGARIPQGDMFKAPTKSGNVTSLYTFLTNNGAKINENGELVSMKVNGKILTGDSALDAAHKLAQEHDFMPQEGAEDLAPSSRDLQDVLTNTNGGRQHTRSQDVDRVLNKKIKAQQSLESDPSYIEHQKYLDEKYGNQEDDPIPFAKGGAVQRKQTALAKKLEETIGRKPSKGEIELAGYVGHGGVNRLLKQSDHAKEAHKMFPKEVVANHKELFFNGKKPYTVGQIKGVLA